MVHKIPALTDGLKIPGFCNMITCRLADCNFFRPANVSTKFLKYAGNFHSCTVHLGTIEVFYLPTDAQKSCFKIILKFTLKQLLHVSVQSPSSGSVLFELAKVIVIKIIS